MFKISEKYGQRLKPIKQHDIDRLKSRYIDVSVTEQRLQLIDNKSILFDAKIATAANGMGEQSGSECTPRGWHIIRAKIGTDCPQNTVFIGRRASGEIYSEQLQKNFPQRDWILTRILWLSGLEIGLNRLGQQDTMQRYIYIHGCPDNTPMGIPSSHGCIRMRNAELIELFDLLETGIPVFLHE